jgi:predicted nucleic acid-binding protein
VTFLLDTNIVSEFMKPKPDQNVLRWLKNADEDITFMSVVSLAELRHGIELLDAGRRKSALHSWLSEHLPERFAGRILAIDSVIADQWGRLSAAARRQGIGLQVMDGFIAATALAHSHVVVTRNVRDFQRLDIAVVNPWQA